VGLLDNWHKWWRQGPEKGDEEGLLNLNPSQTRRAKLTVVILLAGLVLLVSTAPERKPAVQSVAEPALLSAPEEVWSDFQTRLERSLAGTLTQIAGVGEVRVLLTVDGSRREYLANQTKEVRTTVENDRAGVERQVTEERTTIQYVLVTDNARKGEQPIIVQEGRPPIRGVLVIADGARDPRVRLDILRAVETVLGVPAHRIQVMPRK
jgi:stage III sporulation protein AG